MPEQIVDLLEAVEVETEHAKALAGRERSHLLVDARVEEAPVRQARQRVVMRQEMNVLLGILACLQISNRDDVVRALGEDNRPHDQFDRCHRAVAVTQFGFDRLVRL